MPLLIHRACITGLGVISLAWLSHAGGTPEGSAAMPGEPRATKTYSPAELVPVSVDNNDFSKGLEGWNTEHGQPFLIPADEEFVPPGLPISRERHKD